MGVPHILNVLLTSTRYRINYLVSSLILTSTFKTTLLHSQILMFHTVLGTFNSTSQFATTHTKPVIPYTKHAQSPLNLASQQLIQHISSPSVKFLTLVNTNPLPTARPLPTTIQCVLLLMANWQQYSYAIAIAIAHLTLICICTGQSPYYQQYPCELSKNSVPPNWQRFFSAKNSS